MRTINLSFKVVEKNISGKKVDSGKAPTGFLKRSVLIFLISLGLGFSHSAIADISGNAFRDYNNNGVDDGTSEQGIETIVVTAYASDGSQAATTTTNASGDYNLTLGAGDYRIEFTLPVDGSLNFLSSSVSPASSVQFAVNGATVSAGFNSRETFSNPSPNLVTNVYRHGPAVGDNSAALIRFSYNAGCVDATLNGTCDSAGQSFDTPASAPLATTDQIGATMGMAVDRVAPAVYVGSFMKRHVGFQRNGKTGVIYRIENPDSATPGTPTAYVDFDALGIDTGTDPHPADGASGAAWEQDQNSWDAVGKVGFGDIEISADETKLYAVNLFDRRLYTVPIQAAPVTLADISSIAIPNPCADVADFRPFATKSYDSRVYVGVTCTGQSSVTATGPAQLQHQPAGSAGNLAALPGYGNRNLLAAHVLVYDPEDDQFENLAGTASTSAVFTAPLNYPRERAIGSSLPHRNTSPGEWNPWTPDFIVYDRDNVNGNCLADRAYPQPWLTDIEFDRGNLVLGIRDRFGDQTGYQQAAPPGIVINASTGPGCRTSVFAGLFNGITAGDTLRACGTPQSGWTLENNGSCGGVNTPGAGSEGPGGGEYYYQDDYDDFPSGSFAGGFHNDISAGGLVHVPGNVDTVSTMYDPIDSSGAFYDGGIYWLNGDTGARTRGYRTYNSSDAVGQNNLDDTFAKANGLGDLEPLSALPSIEIGNLIWQDVNGDGVQGASEPGIANVTVQLWADTDDNGTVDAQVGTAVTLANGTYVFGGETDANLSSGSLNPSTNYEIRVDETQTALAAFTLTQRNNGAASGGAANADSRDSDASSVNISGTDTAVIAYTTGNFGDNEDNLDIGFSVVGSITIIKDTIPNNAQDFNFRISGGVTSATFTLDDDAGAAGEDNVYGNTQVFSDIIMSRYQASEILISGWIVTDIQCTGATASTITIGASGGFDAGDDDVTIDLQNGEDITCTFTNEPAPLAVESCPVDTNRIVKNGFAVVACKPGVPGSGIDSTLAVKDITAFGTLHDDSANRGRSNINDASNVPTVREWGTEDFNIGGVGPQEVLSHAIDPDNGNIFTGSTRLYGEIMGIFDGFGELTAGPAVVYKIDGVNGAVSVLVNLTDLAQNQSPLVNAENFGIGYLDYNNERDELYVVGMGTGSIYRIDGTTGAVLQTYNPDLDAGVDELPASGDSLALFGERLLGLAYNPVERRVYYSVWRGDRTIDPAGINFNSVRSIALDASGALDPLTDIEEFQTPALELPDRAGPPSGSYNMPVGDIEFNLSGDALVLAEIGFDSGFDFGTFGMQAPVSVSHEARVLRYDGGSGAWAAMPTGTFQLGSDNTALGTALEQGANGRGGVEFSYHSVGTNVVNGIQDFVISTADALNATNAYGFQYTPVNGGGIADSIGVSLTDVGDPTGAKSLFGDVDVLACASDYGDAPDVAVGTGAGNYNTQNNTQGDTRDLSSGPLVLVTSDNGPSHLQGVLNSPFLGECVDADDGTHQNVAATQDDTVDGGSDTGACSSQDDEDGVAMPASLTIGLQATIPVTASSGTNACMLNAWIDFNANGDFTDAGEQIASNQSIAAGATVNLTPTVPSTATNGDTYARFRCTSAVFNGGPVGAAPDGEVEDYLVRLIPQSGTLVIVKNTVPDAPTDFSFSTTGGLLPAGFSLDDDADATLSNTQTYADIPIGTYSVSEIAAPGYTTALVCDDATAVISGRQATVSLDNAETITCTYTNTKVGSITIIKDTAPFEDPQSFGFTATGVTPTAFDLDDNQNASLSDRQVFSSLADGAYSFDETALAGWDLTNINCSGDTASTVTVGAAGGFDVGDTSVDINLVDGEDIVCTYTNTKIITPAAPPTGSLSVTKIVNWNGRTPVPTMDFSYTITGPAGFTTVNDTLVDGATDTFTDVPFGDYTITETSPGTGWTVTYTIDAGTPQASGSLSLSGGTITPITAAPIQGTTYSDSNSDGDQDTGEPGLAGVTVTAYGPDGSSCGSTSSRDGLGSPTAGAIGTYSLTPTCDGPWRLEFTNMPSGFSPSFVGTGNGSLTQFVDDTNLSGNDVGFIEAAGFCQANPKVVTPIYINGDQSGAQSVMSSINYDRTGANGVVAQANQIGSTWGLAYQRDTQVLYASAVVKRHSGLGALGIGGIYAISDPAGTPSPSNFVDVSSLGIDFGTIASNAARGLPVNVEEQNTDAAAYGQAGVIGIGDIDISEDNSTLWMVNLNNRSLVSLDVAGGSVPTSAEEFNVLSGAAVPSCTDGVLRPWALKIRGTTGYMGAVCTGENQADAGVAGAALTLNIARNLVAYVFSFDTSDPLGTFAQELEVPLNYSKEGANNAGVNTDIWMPWRNVYSDGLYNGILGQRPTPMLTDLEIGDDGHLILGFADRSGFQIGGLNRQPDNPGSITSFAFPGGGAIGIQIGGDILKACNNGTGNFVLENNGTCGGVTGSGPALSGPGGASFFNAISGINEHREASTGGLAVLLGSGETVYSAMDPETTLFAGGLQWNNTVANGTRIDGHQFWNGTEFNVGFGGGGRFGKANGQGDVEILCDQAPMQVGNRVWDDLNQNGIQDAGEPGLNGVEVTLTPVGGGASTMVTTAGDGNYLFTVNPTTDYTLTIDTPPVGYSLSPTDVEGNASNNSEIDVRDNDASDNAGTATIAFTSGLAGDSNHGLDFGFFNTPVVAAALNNTAPPAVSLGSTVFLDANNNGTQDSSESGIANVRVQLFTDAGVEVPVGLDGILGTADDGTGGMLTDINGNYFFQQLFEDDYQVRIPASNFAVAGALFNTPSSSTDIVTTPNTDATGVDEDDNGLQAAGSGTQVVSPIINLSDGGETATETNVGGSGGNAQDNADEDNGDMRLDFGFYNPVSLGSTVFNDANNNGIQDAAEGGIQNVTVQLFTSAGVQVPVGPDGILGTADDVAGGVSTDANGIYHFQNLVSGEYEVRIPASNFAGGGALATLGTSSTDIATTPNTDATGIDEDDNGLQAGGSGTAVVTPTIILTAGAETAAETNVGGSGGDALDNADENSGDMRLDMGFYAPVSLGSTVFSDPNNNGLHDAAESGIANVTVQLFTDAGVEVPVGPDGILGTADDAGGGMVTNGSGNYFFQNLVSGNYQVRIPASNFTTGNALAVNRGSSTDIATTPNTDATGVDEDDNGLQVGGLGTEVVSPIINLTAGAETSAESNVGGSGGNAQDDAAENNGDMRLDFGFYAPVSLGSTVFNDANNNGVQNAGEPGIQNVVVQLFNGAGVEVLVGPDGILGTLDDAAGGVITSASGNYFFQGLPPGNYQVRVPVSNFGVAGALGSTPSSSTDIATTPNTDASGVDEDDNGLQAGGSATEVVTPIIILTDNGETAAETNVGGSGGNALDDADEDNGDMRLDLGFYDPVSLGSTVFGDTNDNGLQDASESGIENVTVQLFTSAGVEVPVGPDGVLGTADDAVGGVTTDVNGNYFFQNLVSGDYEVRIPASNFSGGGALSGIGSSSTDIVTTPNTDASGVDEDDNGLQASGSGTQVVSPTITLTAGAETAAESNVGGSGGNAQDDADENSGDMRLDFGFYGPVSLGSTVFADINNNGLHDAGENGIANVTVQLFTSAGVEVPVGPDGILGNADDALGGMVTDGSGNYFFQNLVSGDYQVRIPASNFAGGSALNATPSSSGDIATTLNTDATGIDEDDNGLQAGGQGTAVVSPIINLSIGGETAAETDVGGSGGNAQDDAAENSGDMRLDFGFFQPISLGSVVFEDDNLNGSTDPSDADGVQAADEAGINGAVVSLFRVDPLDSTNLIPVIVDVNGVYVAGQTGTNNSVLTSNTWNGPAGAVLVPNGTYNFSGLIPDNYVITVEPGSGLSPSPVQNSNVADGTNLDSNLDLTQVVPFGVWQSGVIALATTGQPLTEADPSAVAEIDPSGTNDLSDASANLTVDFGFIQSVAIGNVVWLDDGAGGGNANDGILNGAERGISGVKVELYVSGDTPGADAPLAMQVTDDNGNYLFGFLTPGDYVVHIPASNFSAGAPLTGFTSSAPEGGDNQQDDNADENGQNALVAGGVSSTVINLTVGGEPTNEAGVNDGLSNAQPDASTDQTVDFGFVPPLLGSIGNYVWIDEDSDGEQDAGEVGLANITVQLKDQAGAVIDTLTTDANGGYLFTDLPAGMYFVDVDDTTIPTGLTQTPIFTNITDGSDADIVNDDGDFGNKDHAGNGYPITLDAGEDNLTADFGYNWNPDTDVNGNTGVAALGDRIWIDSNGDGVQDPNETPVEGAVVSLFTDPDGDGVFDTPYAANPTQTTDANGNYLFDDLPANAYVVTVTDSSAASHDVLGANYAQTGDPDHFAADQSTADNGTAGDNTSTKPIVLSSGDVFLNADFGYQPNAGAPLGSIGDTLWLDADSDGSGPSIASIDGVNNPSVGQGNNAAADDGEPTIPGVTVSLVKDLDGDGIIDAGEPVISTDISDENGQYLFEDLELGNDYIVWVNDSDNVLNGLTPTYDSNGAVGTPNVSSVTALAGDDREQDFGYVSDDPMNPNDGLLGSIGDTVWADLDASGGDQSTQGNEPGLAGVTVNLYVDEDGTPGPDDVDGNGTVNASDAIKVTTTDANGNYLFTDLALTTYVVGVDDSTLPSGVQTTSTYLPIGAGVEDDVATANDLSDPVTLSATAPHDRSQDFSYPLAVGTSGSGLIGDTVWGDLDSDGNGPVGAGDGSDTSEPLFDNVTVRLFDDMGVLVDTQVTDINGNYLFTGLDPTAIYSVAVDTTTLPAGFSTTPTGDPENDGNSVSLVDLNDGGAGTEDGVNDPDGENGQNLGQDFGYPPVPVAPADQVGSIGDTVWFDVDNSTGDQTTQGAEPGLPSVTVTLTPPAGIDVGAGPGNPITTVTDDNGQYLFSDLPLDDAGADTDYVVTIDTTTLPSYVSSQPSFDPDGGADAESSVAISNSNPDDRDQDFSFPPQTEPASIGDTVFIDNGDTPNTQDDADTPVESVLVNLLADTDGDGTPETVIATQSTDENGQYLFIGLDPNAVYGIEVDPSNFAANAPLEGMTNTVDPDGPADNASVVDLSAGDGNADEDGANNINLGQDFGYTATTPVNVGNLVWLDVDADGVYEPNGLDGIAGTEDDETPIGGVTVEIYRDLDGNGEVDSSDPLAGQTTTSDAIDSVFGTNGNYLFEDLPADTYVVKVTDDDGVLVGYWHSEGDQIADDNSKVEVYPIDATAGDNTTADFGYYLEPGSVGNIVWEDINGNGVYDPATEPGIDDVTVMLTITYPDGSTITLTDTTEFGGVYQFDNLNLDEDFNGVATVSYGAGGDEPEHIVALDQTTTPDFLAPIYDSGTNPQNTDTSDVGGNVSDEDDVDQGGDDGVAGEPAFPPMGSIDSTNDFGFAELASIGNYVWLDLDMDGIQDANEDGIASVTVNLLEDTDGNGVIEGAELTTPVATVTTGPNGEYLFPGLTPGTVYITQVDVATLPLGLLQTYDEGPTPGSLGTLDNMSAPIVLAPSEEHLTADFGYAPPAGSLGDTIWVDSNDNGQQDPGEPGLPGVTVTLQPAPNVDPDGAGPAGPGDPITVVTDENGKYLFTNLPIDQTYIVTVTSGVPPQYMPSPSGNGDPDVRDGTSQPGEADESTTVVISTSNPVNLDADFAYVPDDSVNNRIGDTIWLDIDKDGNGPASAGDGSDVTEPVIPGVTVTLVQDNGDGVFNPIDDTVLATTLTDTNGMYEFTGVPDGDYIVLVTDQNNVLGGLEQTVDSDDPANPGAFSPLTPNASFVDDLGVGVDVPVTNADQDFGYVEPNNSSGDGSIGDTVFFDQNSSGAPDAGEGIEGVTVQLFAPGPDGVLGTADDVLIESTTTNENGSYLFTGLDTSDTGPNPGTEYQVVIDTSSLPNGGAGWINTVDPDTVGTGNNTSITTLTAAEPIDLDQDFGYESQDNNMVMGTIWPDTDGNGELEEAGRFAGVTVELRDQDGNVIQTTETDANGDFEFTNLPDGIYVVVVTDDDNVLNGFEHTDSPNGTSDTTDNTSKDDTGYTVSLDPNGESDDPVIDETSDFGYKPEITNPISLGSFVAKAAGDDVLIEWATQTEVANLGFNVYGLIDGDWVQLNDGLMLGQGDSVAVQSYDITVTTQATVFAISDVDLSGKETLHGPYELGREYGSIAERNIIDWKAERTERERKEVEREQRKLQQQQQRMQRFNQQRLSTSGKGEAA